MGWENDYLISNDQPADREINSTDEEMEELVKYEPETVVGYCPETYRLANGREVLFRHLTPEVQAALTSAHERDIDSYINRIK